MSDYDFELPMPPSINTYRACVRNRLITSKKGRDYFAQVAMFIRKFRLDNENIKQRVMICLTIHPKTNHKYDVSNYLKAYEDALVKCNFLEDDHWIEYGYIKKAPKKQGGGLFVSVDLL
jgi:crossover junction endodeoxyribonuclease RusA